MSSSAGTKRPIRFGTYIGNRATPAEILAAAEAAESAGYSTVALNDHLDSTVSPLLGLQAIAGRTSRLRLTMTVLNQDFRHPAILAKELATLDVLSGGRVEVGIGVGWFPGDYDRAGLSLDPAPVRLNRLVETIAVLRGLFGGEAFSFAGSHHRIDGLVGSPRPAQGANLPIMVGGSGRNLMAIGARHADIVHLISGAKNRDSDPGQYGLARFCEKLDWVRSAAGDRLEKLELGTTLLAAVVDDNRQAAIRQYRQGLRKMVANRPSGPPVDPYAPNMRTILSLPDRDLLESPAFAFGTIDQIAERLLEVRQSLGFSYFTHSSPSGVEVMPALTEALEGK